MDDCKLLIVDNETEFLETLVKRMKRRIKDVHGVESGENSLEWLTDNQTDVVILDVRMRGMDGIQTLREIKKRCPLIEVIMLTAHANMEVAREGMELGAFGYLMKPTDIDKLLKKIRLAYRKKTVQEEKIGRLEIDDFKE